ncbi:MAG: hypothetical protein K1X89_05235 [Myxococcaceae bacterium]|nr:hypothetical protein [Myxococcaceae bacterium]
MGSFGLSRPVHGVSVRRVSRKRNGWLATKRPVALGSKPPVRSTMTSTATEDTTHIDPPVSGAAVSADATAPGAKLRLEVGGWAPPQGFTVRKPAAAPATAVRFTTATPLAESCGTAMLRSTPAASGATGERVSSSRAGVSGRKPRPWAWKVPITSTTRFVCTLVKAITWPLPRPDTTPLPRTSWPWKLTVELAGRDVPAG